MSNTDTAPVAVQGHGATVIPDNLSRLRDHRIPTHVPPSLDPGVFSVAQEYSGDPLVLVGRDALAAGKQAAERALQIARTTLQDESETLHRRHLLAQDRVIKATRPALQKFDAAIERIQAKCTALDDFLRGPGPATTAVQMLEVQSARQALAAMDHATRRKTILAALDNGDRLTSMACTRVPGYLVGCSDEEVADFARTWASRNHPDIVEHRKILGQVLEHTQRGGNLLLSFSTSLSSSQIAAEAQRLAQRAQDAVKAAGI